MNTGSVLVLCFCFKALAGMRVPLFFAFNSWKQTVAWYVWYLVYNTHESIVKTLYFSFVRKA